MHRMILAKLLDLLKYLFIILYKGLMILYPFWMMNYLYHIAVLFKIIPVIGIPILFPEDQRKIFVLHQWNIFMTNLKKIGNGFWHYR